MRRIKNEKSALKLAFVLVIIMVTVSTLMSCGKGGGDSETPLPWYAKANVYQVYGSNTFVNPGGPGIPNLNQSDWEYISEGDGAINGIFTTGSSYKWILVTWSGTPTFYFDAVKVNGFTSYSQFIAVNAQDPNNLLGDSDGQCAVTIGSGYTAKEVSAPGAGNITVYVKTTPCS